MLFFRYDPQFREGAPLVLRYQGMPGARPEERPLAIRARWFSDSDRPLVWETRRQFIAPDAKGWRPLSLEVPVLPRGGVFLRFEISADDDGERRRLGTGFVQPSPALPRERRRGASWQALALQPCLPRAAEPFAAAPSPLGAPISLRARRLDSAKSGLLIAQIDRAFRQLFVAGLFGVGAPALAAALPGEADEAPWAIAFPEIGFAAPEAEIHLRSGEGDWRRARIRIIDPQREPLADGCGVAVVVTSCGRQDLLERTLDSFFSVNTCPLSQFIVVEDGPGSANARLIDKYRRRNIDWLATGIRVGQIAAIDYAYAFVATPYIFHMEDDWEFHSPGFIERSLALLEALPHCVQVWIRAFNDTNRHPLGKAPEAIAGIPFRRVERGYLGKWFGFNFNPGLRRKADYDRLGRYGWHVAYDPKDPTAAERALSYLYGQLGFDAVILADNAGRGYIRHIGFARRVRACADRKAGL